MRLDPLFHWTPAERRVDILREGLRPYAHPVVHGPGMDGERLAFPYLCLGGSPSIAWGLSGGSHPTFIDEYAGGWDLWEVHLGERADLELRPQWGADVQEVRVRTAIPADHVWWCANRTGVSARAA